MRLFHMHVGVGFPVPRHRFLDKNNANKDGGGVPASLAELFAAFLHPLDSHPKRLLPIVGGCSEPFGRMHDVGLGGSTRECHLRRNLVVDYDLNMCRMVADASRHDPVHCRLSVFSVRTLATHVVQVAQVRIIIIQEVRSNTRDGSRAPKKRSMLNGHFGLGRRSNFDGRSFNASGTVSVKFEEGHGKEN